jgi:hypothetical protein
MQKAHGGNQDNAPLLASLALAPPPHGRNLFDDQHEKPKRKNGILEDWKNGAM